MENKLIGEEKTWDEAFFYMMYGGKIRRKSWLKYTYLYLDRIQGHWILKDDDGNEYCPARFDGYWLPYYEKGDK